MTLTLHSTRACRATPRVLFAIEECGADAELTFHDEGWFRSTHGRNGPMLDDAELRLFEAHAIVRHIARAKGALLGRTPRAVAETEMWLDYALSTLRPAALRALQGGEGALDGLRASLRPIEAALEGRAWLAGDFGAADIAFVDLAELPVARALLADATNVGAWCGRLRDRPAWARASARFAKGGAS
jgi:glutathione S-transferase